jgi:hypothetical protein
MKKIVIVGAGFGGLSAAKALRHANAEVCVIDRANHNLFQPLLYQVATTVLSAAQIASPIRGLLKNQRNTTVILGEVSGINKDARFVYASNEDQNKRSSNSNDSPEGRLTDFRRYSSLIVTVNLVQKFDDSMGHFLFWQLWVRAVGCRHCLYDLDAQGGHNDGRCSIRRRLELRWQQVEQGEGGGGESWGLLTTVASELGSLQSFRPGGTEGVELWPSSMRPFAPCFGNDRRRTATRPRRALDQALSS